MARFLVGWRAGEPSHFTGYRISSRVQQAKIAQFQTMTRLEDLRANAMAEIELRLSAWREAEKRIDVQSSTIAMAQRGYRISLLRFREGVGSRLELTDSELQLNKAGPTTCRPFMTTLLPASCSTDLSGVFPAERSGCFVPCK